MITSNQAEVFFMGFKNALHPSNAKIALLVAGEGSVFSYA